MNLPNRITLFRIALTFLFMVFLFSKGLVFKCLALATFLTAVFSDYLDGYIAKRYGLVSNFGKLMDPIADKILTLAAFLAFVEMKLVPAWIVVIIIMREMLITGLRIMALRNGEVLQAELGGKHKTVSQMVSIFIILIFIIFREAGVRVFGFWDQTFEYWYRQLIFAMMLLTALLTIISGASYIIHNKKHITNE